MDDPDDNPDFDLMGWCSSKQQFSDAFVPKFVEEVIKEYAKEGTKVGCTGYW